MERRKVLMVGAGVLMVGGLFYAGWKVGGPGPGGGGGDVPVLPGGGAAGGGRGGRGGGGGEGAGGGGGGAATDPAGGRVLAPPKYHANVMMEDPFPGRPELRATRVSVDAENETAQVVVMRLAEAVGTALGPTTPPQEDVMHAGRAMVVRGGLLLPERMPPGRGLETDGLISVHLRNEPVLEALYQIQAQGPVAFSLAPSTGVIARYQSKTGEPMAWSIAGPFVEVIDKIERRPQNGFRPLGVGEGPGELCAVGMRFYAEPKIRILTYPRLIDVMEARDENGVSLMAPRQTVQPTQPQVNAFPSLAWLSLPRENAGKMIKVLKGKGRFSVEGQEPMEAVTVEDPLNGTPVTKAYQGMSIRFEKPVWNKAENGFDMEVTYQREGYQGDWEAFEEAVGGVKPRMVQGTGRAVASRALYSTIDGGSVKIVFGIQLALVLDGKQVDHLESAPAVEKMMFDMPVGALVVDVPVEFRELAMP